MYIYINAVSEKVFVTTSELRDSYVLNPRRQFIGFESAVVSIHLWGDLVGLLTLRLYTGLWHERYILLLIRRSGLEEKRRNNKKEEVDEEEEKK